MKSFTNTILILLSICGVFAVSLMAAKELMILIVQNLGSLIEEKSIIYNVFNSNNIDIKSWFIIFVVCSIFYKCLELIIEAIKSRK